MTINEALLVMGIASVNDLSPKTFKRIKRDKIKFLHPDRKKSEDERLFFNKELQTANAAIDVIERYLKTPSTGSSRKTSAGSSPNRSQRRNAKAYSRQRDPGGAKRQRGEKQTSDTRDTDKKAKAKKTRRRKPRSKPSWDERCKAAEKKRKREETLRQEEEIKRYQEQCEKIICEKRALKAELERRELSVTRIIVNYTLCCFAFMLTGPIAFVLAFAVVYFDYLAFKHTWASTTIPYSKLGGFFELMAWAFIDSKGNKIEDPNPSLYPYSRLVIDLACMPLVLLLFIILTFVNPLAILIIIYLPFQAIWHICAVIAKSVRPEQRFADILSEVKPRRDQSHYMNENFWSRIYKYAGFGCLNHGGA